MPKISVIMPVYNTKEEYLREAIESILTQTYSDFEFLIVDDASTCDVASIIKSYDDKRICFYQMPQNKGAAETRNFAISQAKGTYLAFMDSDDVAVKERFAKQIKFFENNPEIGCLGTYVEFIGDDKDSLRFPSLTEHEELEAYLVFQGCVFCQSSIMLKKEILDKHNLKYKTEYIPAEDYALWADLVGKTKFAVIPEVLLYYRYYADNISHRKKTEQIDSMERAKFEVIQRYCAIPEFDRELFVKFIQQKTLSAQEIRILSAQLKNFVQALKDKKVTEVYDMIRTCFQKQYYRVRGLSGQLALFQSPLNEMLKISKIFQFFCFVTRGVL